MCLRILIYIDNNKKDILILFFILIRTIYTLRIIEGDGGMRKIINFIILIIKNRTIEEQFNCIKQEKYANFKSTK